MSGTFIRQRRQKFSKILSISSLIPRFRDSARRMSRKFRDRPLSPLDTAIYWIEYVIRNGPNSLKSPAVDIPWWKLNLIDVIVVLIACFILTLYLLFILVKIAITHFYKLKTKSIAERENKLNRVLFRKLNKPT